MIIGPIVKSSVAASRDHVDVSVTVRIHAADYSSGKSTGRDVGPEEWAALKATLAECVARGAEATITTMHDSSPDGEPAEISPALRRYTERQEEASDDGETVDTTAADADSDDGETVDHSWDLHGSDAGE